MYLPMNLQRTRDNGRDPGTAVQSPVTPSITLVLGGDAQPWVVISIGLDSAPYVTLTGSLITGTPKTRVELCRNLGMHRGPLLWHMIGPGPVGCMRVGMPGRQRPTIGTARDRRAGSRARGGACPVQHHPKARVGSSRLPSNSQSRVNCNVRANDTAWCRLQPMHLHCVNKPLCWHGNCNQIQSVYITLWRAGVSKISPWLIHLQIVYICTFVLPLFS